MFAWHDSPLVTFANTLALVGALSLGALRRSQPRPADATLADYGAGLISAGAGAHVLSGGSVTSFGVGSGVMLVAPVEVGAGATIGAGSTITKDTPAEELTLARSKQVTIPGWKRPQKKPK